QRGNSTSRQPSSVASPRAVPAGATVAKASARSKLRTSGDRRPRSGAALPICVPIPPPPAEILSLSKVTDGSFRYRPPRAARAPRALLAADVPSVPTLPPATGAGGAADGGGVGGAETTGGGNAGAVGAGFAGVGATGAVGGLRVRAR